MNGSRTRFLLGTLGVLLLFLVWRFIGPAVGFGAGAGSVGGKDEYADLTADVGRVPGAGRTAAPNPAVEEVEDLKLAALQGASREYHPGRDPWRFVEPPPPPTPPPPPPPTAAQLKAQQELQERLEQERLERERAAAIEAARPKPPQFALTYLGKFGPESRPIGVFTDGTNIFNVQQGDVIQGKFIVAQIGFESVEIRFVDFPNEPAQRLAVGR
ncbi:MAG TPA: hypothetical protein VE078_11380 [Thermoanaerobaculia bacterium]|nr:hypothetical protein [Thermoanaerobaculia bacterium]